MPQMRQPLFLARASYRKRRLRDGARMMPIFGALLLCFPLLWPHSAPKVVQHWVFLFLAWAALIALAAVLSRRLTEGDPPNRQTGEPVPDQGALDTAGRP